MLTESSASSISRGQGPPSVGRRHWTLEACVAVLIVALGSYAQEARPSERREQLQSQLRNRTLQLQSYRMEAQTVKPVVVGNVNIVTNGQSTSLAGTQHIEYSLATADPHRWALQKITFRTIDSKLTQRGRVPPQKIEVRKAFNGREGRVLAIPEGLPAQGEIRDQDEASQEFANTSEAIGILYGAGLAIGGQSIDQWLVEGKARWMGEQTISGHACDEIELAVAEATAGVARVYLRVFLGRDVGSAPVQIELMRGGELHRRVKNDEFREVAPGIWFPIAVTETIYGDSPDDATQYEIEHVVSAFENNPVFAADEFDLAFPRGTPIADRRLESATDPARRSAGEARLIRSIGVEAEHEASAVSIQSARPGGTLATPSDDKRAPGSAEIRKRRLIVGLAVCAVGALVILGIARRVRGARK